jgi:hypothetical protein
VSTAELLSSYTIFMLVKQWHLTINHAYHHAQSPLFLLESRCSAWQERTEKQTFIGKFTTLHQSRRMSQWIICFTVDFYVPKWFRYSCRRVSAFTRVSVVGKYWGVSSTHNQSWKSRSEIATPGTIDLGYNEPSKFDASGQNSCLWPVSDEGVFWQAIQRQ